MAIRTVIHIGAHKTATSLVQRYLRDNAAVTRALRIGVVGRNETNALIGWGKPVLEHPERLRSRIESEFRKKPAAIFISHENSLGRPFDPDNPGLYPFAGERAAAIASALNDLDLRVVFYVRPVASFIESYYLQTVHEGRFHTFEEWFSDFDSGSLRWLPLIETLEEVLGADRIVVGDFNEVEQGQGEFLRRFMIRSGLPVPREISYPPRRNASISERGLQIALEINPHLKTRKERQATRRFLQKHFNNTREPRARPMPDSVRRELDASTEREYEDLALRSEIALKDGLRDAVYPSKVRWARVRATESATKLMLRLATSSKQRLRRYLT